MYRSQPARRAVLAVAFAAMLDIGPAQAAMPVSPADGVVNTATDSIVESGQPVDGWVWDEGGWRWDALDSQWALVSVRGAQERDHDSGTASAITAYVTAYTWHDNTPSGSAAISHPVLHNRAGGVGTYDDPVTIAVGHSRATGQDVLDWPRGARFYFPRLQVYGIVEDTCGDGPTPQLQPCHRLDVADNPAPPGASTWLDVWIDGSDTSAAVAAQRAAGATGLDDVVVNPGTGLPVRLGPIADGFG